MPNQEAVNEERHKVQQVFHMAGSKFLDCEKFSGWRKLVRVTAYVQRFVQIMKAKCKKSRDERVLEGGGPLNPTELKHAEMY